MQITHLCLSFLRPSRRERKVPTKTLLVMKLTTIFLFVMVLQGSARTIGQTVTYTARSQPIPEILAAFKQQT
ncbi:MAG: hypothetical protein JST39_18910, partial [Bacteroidetes bacterium]|nr:hypothetical protein [Bacteroidota bacterium]